jgi:hypothetical protein
VHGFDALAAVLAVTVLARQLRRALAAFGPRGRVPAGNRLGAVASLLACLVAAVVLAVAAKGLLLGHPTPGANP